MFVLCTVVVCEWLLLKILRPPRSPLTYTLLPCTTRFRSQDAGRHDRQGDAEEGRRLPLAEIERGILQAAVEALEAGAQHGDGDGKSTRLNSSHQSADRIPSPACKKPHLHKPGVDKTLYSLAACHHLTSAKIKLTPRI